MVQLEDKELPAGDVEPAGQEVHAEAPAEVAYMPAGHALQVLAPEAAA